MAARATVGVVSLEGAASAPAGGLARRTRELAPAGCTEVAGRAHVATGAAVESVGPSVDAGSSRTCIPTAAHGKGLVTGETTVAQATDTPRGACATAPTTVAVVGLDVHTLSTARGLADRALDLAHADRAYHGGGAGVAAGSAVCRVRLEVRTTVRADGLGACAHGGDIRRHGVHSASRVCPAPRVQANHRVARTTRQGPNQHAHHRAAPIHVHTHREPCLSARPQRSIGACSSGTIPERATIRAPRGPHRIDSATACQHADASARNRWPTPVRDRPRL